MARARVLFTALAVAFLVMGHAVPAQAWTAAYKQAEPHYTILAECGFVLHLSPYIQGGSSAPDVLPVFLGDSRLDLHSAEEVSGWRQNATAQSFPLRLREGLRRIAENSGVRPIAEFIGGRLSEIFNFKANRWRSSVDTGDVGVSDENVSAQLSFREILRYFNLVEKQDGGYGGRNASDCCKYSLRIPSLSIAVLWFALGCVVNFVGIGLYKGFTLKYLVPRRLFPVIERLCVLAGGSWRLGVAMYILGLLIVAHATHLFASIYFRI